MRPPTPRRVLAALAAFALLAGCSSQAPDETSGDGAEPPAAGSPSPSAAGDVDPECLTELDRTSMLVVPFDENTDSVNTDGYAFTVEGNPSGGPAITHASDVRVSTPVTGLPAQDRIHELRSYGSGDGFIVESWAPGESALDPEDPPAQLSRVNSDGTVAWSQPVDRYAVAGVSSGLVALYASLTDIEAGAPSVFLDAETGQEVAGPTIPHDSWYVVDGPGNAFAAASVGHSGQEVFDVEGNRLLTDITVRADKSTEEWVLRAKPSTQNQEAVLSGQKHDGTQSWTREIRTSAGMSPDGSLAVSVCGQYVYVNSEDGIHVLDQAQGGAEVGLIEGDDDGPTAREGVHPPGFLTVDMGGREVYLISPAP